MRKLQVFVSSLLLMTSPSMLVYPEGTFQELPRDAVRPNLPLYNEVLLWINEIEAGTLEEKCSPQELERSKHLIAFLAKQGQLSDASDEERLSLEEDIEALLNGESPFYESAFAFVMSGDYRYMIMPAVLHGPGEVMLCKSWLTKQWHHVKHFVKKHKKAIVIGTTVAVAATLVIVTVGLGTAAVAPAVAGAAAAAGASSEDKADKRDSAEEPSPTPVLSEKPSETTVASGIADDRLSACKEYFAQGQFFQAPDPLSGEPYFPWEESTRVLGSLFAHKSLEDFQLGDLHSNFSPLVEHSEIDRQFSTDYGYLFSNIAQGEDLNFLSYQIRGERALSLGYYHQAIQDFGKALEVKPDHTLSYLERGVAHFGLGDYHSAMGDYEKFASQVKNLPSASDFTFAFAKGVTKGVYASGEGIMLFLADFVTHPIQTSWQMLASISQLVNLMCNEDWALIAEVLSPEVHHLVAHWETLPLDERGELLGYALGKHGADILLPGAAAKLTAKGVKSAQELAAVFKNIQMAEEMLLLETSAGIGNAAKIAEAIEAGQKTVSFAEELGLTASEMGQLKQAGQLEMTIAHEYEHLNLSIQESIALHARAKQALMPYIKKPMPESRVRELIHATGIPTFPRPAGIPENFLVMISEKGGGMLYQHPEYTHTSIRIMPGKLHSSNPSQQRPYVIHLKNGNTLDKYGNKVDSNLPTAHIRPEEFVYTD